MPLDLTQLPNHDPVGARRALHRRGHGRRQDLRRAEGLGHHRLRHQRDQGDGAPDDLEGVLGPDHDHALGQGHGARLPAHHHRQRAQVLRLFVQLDRAGPNWRRPRSCCSQAKPHLFAINSDYKPSMLSGDAVMSICWTGDAVQLRRENEAHGVRPRPRGRRDLDRLLCDPVRLRRTPRAAYALINYLMTPEVNAKEVLFHGYPSTDSAHQRAAAEGAARGSDPLSGGRAAGAAGIRRRRPDHQRGPRRALRALQVGVSRQRPSAPRCPSRGSGGEGGRAMRPVRRPSLALPRIAGRGDAVSAHATAARHRPAAGAEQRSGSCALLHPAAGGGAGLLVRRAGAGRRLSGGLHLRQLPEPAGAADGLQEHADPGADRHRDLPRRRLSARLLPRGQGQRGTRCCC